MLDKACSACGCQLATDDEKSARVCPVCKLERECLPFYAEGGRAFEAGQALFMAPYAAVSVAWNWWRTGWLDAYSYYKERLPGEDEA